MQKNREKICIYKKLVVILHRQIKNETRKPNLETQKLKRKMNKTYMTKSYGEIVLNTATINRNFRIKVAGLDDGVRVNKLVGVRGLLKILGTWAKVVKFVLRAFDCLADKCVCKIYGGAKVTFYAK